MEEKIEIPKESEQKLPERTDMAVALFWATHIDTPDPIDTESGNHANNREFYLSEAKKALLEMKESYAKEFLKSKIKEYEDIE